MRLFNLFYVFQFQTNVFVVKPCIPYLNYNFITKSLSRTNYIWCVVRFGTILNNLKNVKSTHRGVLILVKLQASALGVFHVFKIVKNGTKSRNASHILIPLHETIWKLLALPENLFSQVVISP